MTERGTSGPARLTEMRARLADYLRRRGLRSTAQRRLVTEVFFETEGHVTVEELLQRVRARDPRIGHATIYRTLKLLKDSGLAHERRFGDGVTRYELAHEDDHHDHLICLDCGRIVEFEDEAIERAQERVAERHGFELLLHRHELYGRCEACRAGRGERGA